MPTAVGDAVADVEELDPEHAQFQLAIRRNRMEFAVGEQARLLQLDLRQPAGERCRIHGHVQVLQQVWQRANVILMAVREEDSLHAIRAFGQIRDIGIHQVDARHIALRKHQPGIDDENILIVLQRQQVLPNLSKPAQRDHLQRYFAHKPDLPDSDNNWGINLKSSFIAARQASLRSAAAGWNNGK